jgi:hypothetical protein
MKIGQVWDNRFIALRNVHVVGEIIEHYSPPKAVVSFVDGRSLRTMAKEKAPVTRLQLAFLRPPFRNLVSGLPSFE